MKVVVQEAFRAMDGEAERYMDVLERPPEAQPLHRSAFIPYILERLLRLYKTLPLYYLLTALIEKTAAQK